MDAAGNKSNMCSSDVEERDDKNINPKLLPCSAADEVQANPTNVDSSLTNVERTWSSAQAFVSEKIASMDLDFGCKKEVVELYGHRYVGWNDLRDIALCSLHVFFKTTFEMISQKGYSEDNAIHAISESTLCYQFDGPITKIADNAHALVKTSRQVDSSLSENLDMHLHMLGFYILSHASSLLKKYFPFFTWGDAIWCLLLCDMDMSIARAFSVDMNAYENEQPEGLGVNNQNVSELSGGSAHRNSKSPGGPAPSQCQEVKHCRAILSRSPEKMWIKVLIKYLSIQRSAKKGQVSSSGQVRKSSSLHRAVITYNKKAYKGPNSKRSLKECTLYNALIAPIALTADSKLDSTKGLKSSTSLSSSPFANPSPLKRTDATTVASTPLLPSPVNSSSSSSSTIDVATKQQMKPKGLVQFSLPNTPADGFEFHFSHDGMQTAWVPKDRKEELALSLIRRLGELKLEEKVWMDWANDRVLQSIRRLGLEKTILESLRKERRNIVDYGVLYRAKLEETQTAIDNTSEELNCLESLVYELTRRIALYTLGKEVAKSQEKQSVASLVDISSREDELLDRLNSMEAEITLLQEELAAKRNNLSKLHKDLEQAQQCKNVLQRRRQEGVEMVENSMKKINIARNEVERFEVSARTCSSKLLVNTENIKQRLQAKAKLIKQEIKEIEFALANGSMPQSVAKCMPPPGSVPPYSVMREQECLMCLEEDISVVFLPCRHQVLCDSCNHLHRDQGMTDCPSCRSPIERRICARFDDAEGGCTFEE